MSWTAVLVLSAAAYAMKLAGFVLARRVDPHAAERWSLELVVVPVLAALIVVQTVDGGEQIVIDARLPALAVAALLVWRRAPLLVIVLAAGGTAAGLRLLGAS